MSARPQVDLEATVKRPKPCVYYTPHDWQKIQLGGRALVFGVRNHPGGLKGECVSTSYVVAIHPAGVFETENTVYLPIV